MNINNLKQVGRCLYLMGKHKLALDVYNEAEQMADEDDEVSPEQIHAAMERASKSGVLPPLNLKEPKPKRRFNTNNRRKKPNAG